MSQKTNQLLFLNTKDSRDPSTPHDSNFILTSLFTQIVENYSISFESIIFPNTYYPINQTNNQVYFQENSITGVTYNCALTIQSYNGAEMAVELQTQLNATAGIANTYVVTYDTQKKKLQVSAGVLPNSIKFVSGTNNANALLGFDTTLQNFDNFNEAENPIDITGPLFVDVVSNISASNFSTSNRSNILARIPIQVPFGSIVYYQDTTDDKIKTNYNGLTNLEFRLLTDKGDQYILPSNSEVSYVLKFSPN